ncbi:MAG: SPASM domain-containing protein [Planctomycetota bacterium]|nr:SPASM domain-containing protein [Planctomycetota bacterium]
MEKFWRLSGKEILLVNFEPVPVECESGDVQDDWVCPFLGREMWVNTEGRFDVCCAPDELRRTLGDFGNVHDKDVLDLWHSQEYSELCENHQSRKVCRNCLLRRREDEANG